jgi:DHA1 family bicyclomycin/chloramphenicol resistance-like MFS transporter
MLYLLMSGRFGSKNIITFAFFMIMASGLILIFWGNKNPFLFALGVLPASLAVFVARPPGINLLLEAAGEASGAGSSLINFFGLLCGSMGMLLISLDWDNRINVFGLTNTVIGLICFILWPLVWKK